MAINRSSVIVTSATDVSAYLVQEFGITSEEAVDLCMTPYGEKEVKNAIAFKSMAYYPGIKIMQNNEKKEDTI